MYEEIGSVPEHLIEPELSDENRYSIKLWDKVKGLVMVDYGRPYALNVADIANFFEKIGVENLLWELEKMQVIFKEIYVKKDKNE
ncbi:MAG: hypothetical protein JSV88_25590 [Candidatus Aminicenantes bacterium]|nr:MAG: hypothetical protein JSV88_25590 [Candidatus Aminicenantes bacterium]